MEGNADQRRGGWPGEKDLGSGDGKAGEIIEGGLMPEGKWPIYIADTHSLIWYFVDPVKRGANADKCFREVEEGRAQLIVPAIVMAEIIYIIEKGKTKADVDDLIRKIQESENFKITSLGIGQLFCFRERSGLLEMHDRLVVCEALTNNASVITKDREIKNSGLVEFVW